MKLRIESDLHLEFHKEFILDNHPDDNESILILAGDICLYKKIHKYISFFEDISRRFKKIIYVPGNHEYYNGTIQSGNKKLKEFCDENNIIFLNNDIVEIEDVTFIGSCLWGGFDNGSAISFFDCNFYMNDHSMIRLEPLYRKFKPEDAYSIHLESIQYITNKLQKNKKTVVITHHAPSRISISEKYQNSNVNGAYVGALEHIIQDYQPVYWVHGHLHEPVSYFIDKTNIISNPTGYPGEFQNHQIKIVEVK